MSLHGEIGSKKTVIYSREDYGMPGRFIDGIPLEARDQLLASASTVRVSAGERLIRQGREGNEFYVIVEGECLVNMEKEGITYLVGRLGAGNVVGELSILTGEPRTAHVDAETDMELICITRQSFEDACSKFPSLRRFLTRLVNDRLSHSLLMADRTIGRYVIEKPIGAGGCSVVYKGYHSKLNVPVAIKMLRHDMAMDPVFIERFRNEAQTIAQLNHENILKVYDVEELYRTFFIIMEHVEGRSLADILDAPERPTLPSLLDYLVRICAGLSHAHENGVIHRDIKPGNIVIQADNQLKIVDFGFACSPGTADGKIVGTAMYISPELIRGAPADARADIYSLGIMAYEMFTGKKPCPEDNFAEIFTWHLTEDVKDPRRDAADLPPELSRMIVRAARRDPDERYPNVDSLLRDIEPLAEKMGLDRNPRQSEPLNMTGLFVFYRDEHRSVMQRLIHEFGRELEKVGARLRGANFKDVQK